MPIGQGRDKMYRNVGESPESRKRRRNVMPSPRHKALLGALLACVLAIALGNALNGAVLAQGASPPAKSEPAPAVPGLNSPAPLQPGDAFGEEVTLPERTIVYLKGHTNWDTAFDTLIDAFKSLNEYLDKQGIKPDGPLMTIYTETDDTGFSFEAAAPIAQAPANPPKGDIAI